MNNNSSINNKQTLNLIALCLSHSARIWLFNKGSASLLQFKLNHLKYTLGVSEWIRQMASIRKRKYSFLEIK